MPVKSVSLFTLFLFCLCLQAQAADVELLLGAMTLDEKLTMLHGDRDPNPEIGLDSAGYIRGVPRLGIPDLRLADGPAGIRTRVPATALPAPIALAASFDEELAYRYGATMGMEGLARNQQVLLSPMVNIIRVPYAGRNFETLGEDPLLASIMVSAEIKGIQSKGMMATVKHFAANNQEDQRLTMNAVVDARTLREIYLPAFEAAVKSDVASIMCAYNKVNGAYACDNQNLLQQILRNEWGYKGYVMSDWWAQHSLQALANGLNLEMPGFTNPYYDLPVYFEAPLRNAVLDGAVTVQQVDAALRPLLVEMNKYALLDGKPTAIISREQDNSAVALEAALKSAVLLKNTNATLPLQGKDLDQLVLMGRTAEYTLIGGGGSSRVLPSNNDSTLSALRAQLQNQLANPDDLFIMGIDTDGVFIPRSALWPTAAERTATALNHTGGAALSKQKNFHWEADLLAPASGEYEMFVHTDGFVARLFVNDKLLVLNDEGVLGTASLVPTRDGLRNTGARITLAAGKTYHLRVEAQANLEKMLQIRLAWLTPAQKQANLRAALARAAKATAVVVFANVEGSEGFDRTSLALPGDQDNFITQLAKVTTGKLIVVLNVGAPITMPWVNDVDAILQMWYPGQMGGHATAALLLGQANPGGKLPVTFPASEKDIPTTDSSSYPGVNNEQHYTEGLLVGYRWYDDKNITPLFPFGHGLSYTTFAYRDLQITNLPDGAVQVDFTVTNTGTRAGAEVAQVYVSQDNTTVQTEHQKLAAFTKVELAQDESRTLSMTIPARTFAWWNESAYGWQSIAGNKTFKIGSSSRDIRLENTVEYLTTTLTP